MKLGAVYAAFERQHKNIALSHKYIELFFVTFLPVIIGFQFNPTDPFFLQSPFPILLLPPFLFAMSYGTVVSG